jgi:ubiquinone/menaquinone biosynthesis C-methylase UbiE
VKVNDDGSTKKAEIAAVFDKVASDYDHIGPPRFALIGRRLVELAEIPVGANVLDIASGRGAVLIPAAQQVGPGGHVVGIDLSEEMIQQLDAEIRRLSLANAEVRQMDAEQLDFPDAAFDRVLCGFALFFFPRLDRALSEFRRVLKPGGRIAVSTWGKLEAPWQWYDELREAYSIPRRPLVTQPLDQLMDVEMALVNGGFSSVQARREDLVTEYKDEEEWWSQFLVHGGRFDLAVLEPDVLARFKADAFARIRALKQPDGVYRPVRPVLFASGINPK